jgi:hypothetical protein
LRIPIKYRGIESSYYLLDKKLASNASGFQGTMFPPNKLPDVMRRIVADLSHNYKDVLLGDPETWKRIEVMESENRRYIENRTQELSKKYQYGNTIQLAMEAFRKKEYVRVCEVLDPIEVHLEPLQKKDK